jgi:K(+)-stimulated pyrophosphate-energized sodium pump
VIVGAVYVSKRRGIAVGDEEGAKRSVKSADPAVVS